MMDEVIQKIRIVVSEFTANDEVFTAVDVARRLRDEGETDLDYTDIRKTVHDMFESNLMPRDYVRKYASIQIHGSTATVWAYYPSWKQFDG